MARGRLVLLVVASLLALVACDGGPSTQTDGDTTPPDAAAPTPDADEAADDAEEHAGGGHPAAGLERAVWVHLFDASLKTRTGLERLVEELARADATAVIAQVARRHDAYYGSEVLPATADPDLEPGLDVLAELTSLARDAGIEVHAWISIAPTWHAAYDDLPAPDGWVPAAHGRSAPEADRWVSRDVDGNWSEYLDPALPEVRAHVGAVVEELATTTEVDGVHLDYVRYASHEEGYHPAALDRYRAETDTAGTPSPDDPAWSEWRRTQTRELVAQARAAVDGAERPVALSAAVIAWGAGPGELGGFSETRTSREALQDWPGWVEDDLVDAVLPMAYFRDHVPEQAAWFTDWLAFQADLSRASQAWVVPGVGGWLNAPDAVFDQLGASAEAADGAALYSYQQPADHADASIELTGVRPFWEQLARSNWGSNP